MRQLSGVLLLSCCLLAFAGCSTLSRLNPFATEQKDDSPALLADFKTEAKISVKWDVSVGSGFGTKYLALQPAVEGERVFAADAYGTVSAFATSSGKRLWTASVGKVASRSVLDTLRFWRWTDRSFVTAGVGAGDGAVFIGTLSGEVVALDAITGKDIWRAKVSSEVAAPPETDGDIVAVQTLDGKLVALDRATGQRRWSYDTQVPILSLRGSARPTFAPGGVIGAFASGRVVVLHSKGGEPVWEHRVAIPQGKSELDRIVDVDGAPAVDGTTLYVASYQGRIKALNITDGNVLWDREFSSHQSLAVGGGEVYAVGKEDKVFALDKRTDATIWEVETLKNRSLTAPAIVGGYVAVGDADGYLHVLAQSDGRIVARTKIDGDGLRSDFVVVDEVLYGLSNGGTLFAATIKSTAKPSS